MSPTLNPSQRLAVTIVLCRFEQELRQTALWLQAPSSSGTLYRTSLALSAEQRAGIAALIEEALRLIAELAERFALSPAEESLANQIAASMSVSWADLVDTRSAKLARYGPAAPALREALDPDIERLAQIALSISTLAQE
jgi:hypothetical protein